MSEEILIENFLQEIEKKFPKLKKDFPIIKKACEVAIKAHKWQKRKYSWWPYIEHPISVAKILAKKFWDSSLIISWILHDTVEDCEKIDIEYIYTNFWKEIWFIVDSVTDNIDHFNEDPQNVFKDKIEKLLHWWIKNVKCLLLKLADRNNNIDTLQWLNPDKQIRMSFETQAIYEPLKKLFKCEKNKESKIKFCKDTLKHYLSANKIWNAKDFKKELLNQTFFGIDSDTFNMIYKNTGSISRKIEDKDVFEKLIQTKWFDEKIEVINIEQDISWNFCAIFKYKEWNIFSDLESKLKIHTNFS